MRKIILSASWSHHTITVTTDYPAGEHQVSEEVYAAAVKAGVHQEEDNGNRTAKTGAKGSAGTPEG